MAHAPNGVALAGFMAVGKSTVGPLVAARVGLPWWDLDQRIETTHRRSVSALFGAVGEAGFRALELDCMREGLALGPAVVSLGGGALLSPQARATLDAAGVPVVVLHAPFALLAARIAASDRPLGAVARDRFHDRRAHYASLGPMVSTVGRTPEQVADAVVACLLESQ